jgi:FkbM family methyltransferase
VEFHRIKALRAIFLPLLARFNIGDITIKHHYTADPVRLHSYRHKGYWFHGKEREWDTMSLFKRVLREGDTVFEVGAHIGYISLFFKQLVGKGSVIVFEPGANNLPYLRKNVAGKGIEIVEKAVGREKGVCSFFLDKLSGQNNSMVKDFFMREETESNAFDPKVKGSQETKVEVITVDSFVEERGIKPTFIKIDIEGFEFEALEGMKKTLADSRPMLMVEVQMHHQQIASLLESLGYVLLMPDGQPNPVERTGNVFCFHRDAHRKFLSEFQSRNGAH